MPDHTAVQFCDERHRECPGGAQCGDDELLRVIADLQGIKRGDRYFGDRVHVGVGFAADDDLGIRGFLVSLLVGLGLS